MSKKDMPKTPALIHLEYKGNGKMDREVEGFASTILNLFLNGIESTFDTKDLREAFKEGVEMVFEHWDQEEKKDKTKKAPEFFSCRIVCVLSDAEWWTPGKLYDVVDGYVVDDEGDEHGPFLDIDELNNLLSGDFYPIVENY